MAIILTPTAAPDTPCCGTPTLASGVLSPVACTTQGILSAPITHVNSRPLYGRTRAISLSQGQCASIDWTMHDTVGHPVDLRGCGFDDVASDSSSVSSAESAQESEAAAANPYSVRFRMREHLAIGQASSPSAELTAEILNGPLGEVRVALPATMVGLPGVYYGEMALVYEDPDTEECCIIFSNVFTVIINRGQFGTATPNGPPSLAEIRLHLRDSGGAESFLTDHVAFDDAEIAMAIGKPVDEWNDTPPDLGRRYSTQTFPYRSAWLDGITGYLFLMASEQFRRNQFDYSAAGVTVNDQNKERNYDAAALYRLSAWRDFLRRKKAALNLEACYGGIGSPYGRMG